MRVLFILDQKPYSASEEPSPGLKHSLCWTYYKAKIQGVALSRPQDPTLTRSAPYCTLSCVEVQLQSAEAIR
jgi:hypothetical protein